MKEKILEIAERLKKHEIDATDAQTLLLGLFSVSGSAFGDIAFVDEDSDPCKNCRYAGTSATKHPCSWCSDFLGTGMHYL